TTGLSFTADVQLRLYKNYNIDRYTYKNNTIKQFKKGLIDSLVVGNYELVVMLKEHGSEVFSNLFSWDTIKNMFSSLGESFTDVFSGDAYMKGKSIITVILSTMGATALLNLITRGALKAGVKNIKSAVYQKVNQAYTVHTPKIDSLDITSGRNFPKSQTKQTLPAKDSAIKNTSLATSVGLTSQIPTVSEKINTHTMVPEKIPQSFHLPKNSYEIQGNTLLLRTFDNISEAELEKSLNILIRDNNIKTLRLDSSISHEAHRQIANIIMRNHPLFEMMRLIHGNDVVNITFGGIKDLNDLLGQKFVDDFVGGAVRREIISRFDTYSESMMKQGQKTHNRLVRNDYKNLTPSFEGGTFSPGILFGPENSKKSFIDSVLKSNDIMIREVAQEKGLTVDVVRQTIHEKLDFGVGIAKVTDATPIGKMQAFYEAEIISRKGLKKPGIEIISYDIKKIEACAQRVVQIEKEVLDKFSGKNFTFRGVEYPVTLPSGHGGYIINPDLLGYVRKYSAEFPPESKVLVQNISDYISYANQGFDFIAPIRKWSDDIPRVEKMERDFQKGIIYVQNIQETFKGVLTKEALTSNVEGKKGMLVFLDVRGMGIDNIQSFVRLARKVESGKYDKADLMTGGDSVTNKFITFTNNLKTKNISLGGDEAYLFFEGIGPEGAPTIIADIHKALAESGLKGRIAHGFETTDVAQTFKTLDSSTKVHKMFEEMIDALAQGKNIDADILPRTIHIKSPNDIPEEIFVKGLKGSEVIALQIQGFIKNIARGINPIQEKFLYHSEGRNFMTEITYQGDLLNIHFIPQ
ncbi:hypothetical protein CO024_02125, partial [Candidatus Gracilibacteria bacterium CG_4_9_14_0_2_um_filter_38_7]